MQVIKRDMRVKKYEEARIFEAIKSAYADVYNNPLSADVMDDIYNITLRVNEDIEDTQKEKVTVEEIQDIVVKNIKQYDELVANAYQRYREERTEAREKASKKEKFYTEILMCSNIDNDNANVNQYSFSGRKYRIADYEQKSYALRNLIDKDVREAFEDGLLYPHDLSSYSIGESNCLFPQIDLLLANGFKTRNCDVRPANSFSTACQLVAVIFQLQSQTMFGGVASVGLDWELEPYAHKSFVKLFKEGLFEKYGIEDYEKQTSIDKYGEIHIDNKWIQENYPLAYDYAIRHLIKEGKQSTQALWHNLGTLESRAGSQIPFSSLNYGRNQSTYGKMIDAWLLDTSIEGVGKFNRTSIFPISIFQYKKGVNDKEGTPNYDLKLKAIESMCKRIYPNWANGDWLQNQEDPNDYRTFFGTMGCRTLLGKDIHTGTYNRNGRGNVSPTTIILPKIGLECGIALGKRNKPDIEKFYKELDKTLDLTIKSLVDRYEYICNQSPKSAQFMYENNSILDADKCIDTVREAMKHGTNAVGILGMAECCVAMFGKHHGEDLEAYKFALDVVKYIDKRCQKETEERQMNFSQYFSPSENLCKTARQTLELYYGEIKGVTDRPYLSNSIHIPVWFECDAYSKMLLEAPFTQYGKGGCITYVELSTNAVNNPKGIEKLIDYAMALNIPYLAFNFPIDTCDDCGYSSQIVEDLCPVCGGTHIQRLKRVTGYISTDYHNFNDGKFAEANDRVVHETFNPITIPMLEFAKKELESYGIEVPKVD